MTAPIDQWWCINGEAIMVALRQVDRGESSPEIAYLELVANSEVDTDE